MSHRKILQRNHVYLKEHLDVEKILDELYQREVFSLADKERCLAKHGTTAQSDELLCILPRRGRTGYTTFLQILQLEKVQPYIKDHLEGRESGDSSTVSAPDQHLLDEMERLEMEAVRPEKTRLQLTTPLKEFEEENVKMLRKKMLRKQLQQVGLTVKPEIYMGISHDVAYHTLRFPRQRKALQCPKIHLDSARANTWWCQVTEDVELVNSLPATQHRHSGRLRTYRGTCVSTPISLPPSPSTVTPVPHTPQYWETHSRVGVVGGGWWYPALEMGVGEESQVDSQVYVCRQPRSWCVSVGRCGTHRLSLCTRVWQQREAGQCYSNTMSATPGTQATLHYGIVLDVGRGRLAFIDLDRQIVLAKMDVEWRESLLPMFGAGSPDLYTVNMKVISGADIAMTDTKMSLIYDAMN